MAEIPTLENQLETGETPQRDPIGRLRRLRFEYSDEIPEKIIHSGTGQIIKNKARKGWWQSLLGTLGMAVEDGLVSSQLTIEIDEFVQRYATTGFNRRPTSSFDISDANNLIDKILAESDENQHLRT
jgi:hypothetical protein